MPDHRKLLWEGWMRKVEELLEQGEVVEMVHPALPQRSVKHRLIEISRAAKQRSQQAQEKDPAFV